MEKVMLAKTSVSAHAYDSKLEAAYAEVLDWRLRAREVQRWMHHALTLKLADDVRYTPDFLVVASDGVLECHECKGFMRDDARVKLRVAARLFPFRFILVTRPKTGWVFETITP